MSLKGKLKYAALTFCVFGGAAGALAGIGKAVNEFYETRRITPHGIYATESTGWRGKIRLDWQEGSGAWIHYSDGGKTSNSYFADNPLGENIKVIWDDFSCVESGEDGFERKLEPAKQHWAELCEEIDCKGLYAEWQNMKGL